MARDDRLRWRRSATVAVLVQMTAFLSCSSRTPGPTADPEAGISETLAANRARTIHDLRYTLSFDLPASRDAPVMGRAGIRLRLTDARQPLVLDFEPGADHVSSLTVGGRPSRFRAVNGHLVIPAAELAVGETTLDVAFRAGDTALNRNPDFLYTLFVPARAHLTFPCFDQPDLKGRYSLELTHPTAWQSTANGAERERTMDGNRVRVQFAETPPISTYLFAFAAGDFRVDSTTRGGRAFRMFHRETDTGKIARNREDIFDLHAGALTWLEEYTARPYPFGKFDIVMIPSFQFTGMEHPGAILYNASAMLLDESATENQLLGRANTIAHETAHMWFGDLVTMRWFDDVWMKEVFANFMAAKIANPAFPAVNHELRFLTSHYPAAFAVDRTAGTHPIRQPLDNLKNAGSQYGAIIYQKAPIVMRQLELLLGPDALRDGLRQYLRQFAFGNATWLDLVALLDERTDRDLQAWSRAWVLEAGRPVIEAKVDVGADGTLEALTLTQADTHASRALRWTQRLDVVVGASDGVRSYPVELGGAQTPVPAAQGRRGVRFVLPTGGGIASGEVRLDPVSRRYLLEHVSALADPVTRGAAWMALWEEVLHARLSPTDFIRAALVALAKEEVQQNVSLIVSYVRDAYWRYLPKSARLATAPSVERTMQNGLARAKTASAKATYFNALRSMALTPAAIASLERIWARREKVPGLPLAEPDEATLALELAVRSVPNADAILTEQLSRFTNPDRKARFAFVTPALSASSSDREAFFAGLATLEHRRREPWVVEGLSYLHHPLRAAEAHQFVRPALDQLEEIQRTGDIFFPKNWMDAVLGGHQSTDVANTVRRFLGDHPDYPVRLRRIILQSADDLFRAANIVDQTTPNAQAGTR